jgi:hypothetical protein
VAKKRLNNGSKRSKEKIKASKGSSNTKTIVQVRKVVERYSRSVVLMPAFFKSSLKSLKKGERV